MPGASWLEDRIRSFASPGPRIIGESDSAARAYWLAATGPSYAMPEHGNRTDEVLNDEWTHESEARRALIKQVNGSREILRSRCGQKILRPLTGLVMWPLTCDNCRDGGI